MDEIKVADELYHHGIVGMKWGSRNGPPYPLNKKVSKQIKKGNNPQYKKDEAYRKEREKLNKGEEVQTEGFSLGKKKKKLFDKGTKINELSKTEEFANKVQDMIDEDAKYLDSRKFGSNDLRNLTNRFNDESAYNEALSRKFRTENDMLMNRSNKMSRAERKKYEKMLHKYETDAAYNDAVRRQIDSQINLIRSQQTLKELTTKPKKKSLIRRGAEQVGNSLGIGVKAAMNKGSVILFNELLNQGLNKFYTKSNKHSSYNPNDIPSPFSTIDGGGKGKNNKGNKGGNGGSVDPAKFAKAFKDAGVFDSFAGVGGAAAAAAGAAKSSSNSSKSNSSGSNSSGSKVHDYREWDTSKNTYTDSFFNSFKSYKADDFSKSTVNAGEKYVHNWNEDNHNTVLMLPDKKNGIV